MISDLVTMWFVIVFLSATGGLIGILLGIRLYQNSRQEYKRKRKPIYESNYFEMLSNEDCIGMLPKQKPLDTSWGNMSEKEKARLDKVIIYLNNPEMPMDFSGSRR